jgi:excisionase family DNA binding protein
VNELTFNDLPATVQTILHRLQTIENLVRDFKQPQKEDELFAIEQAAEYLNLKKATLYGLVCHRKIPYLKPGKKLYFKKSDLTNWILTNKK